jgi:hypothetical protein
MSQKADVQGLCGVSSFLHHGDNFAENGCCADIKRTGVQERVASVSSKSGKKPEA